MDLFNSFQLYIFHNLPIKKPPTNTSQTTSTLLDKNAIDKATCIIQNAHVLAKFSSQSFFIFKTG